MSELVQKFLDNLTGNKSFKPDTNNGCGQPNHTVNVPLSNTTGSFIVWSVDREGWRQLFFDRITKISTATVGVQKSTVLPTTKVQTGNTIEMTLDQQQLFANWAKSTVANLAALKSTSDVVFVIKDNGNGLLKVTDKQSGLSIDL